MPDHVWITVRLPGVTRAFATQLRNIASDIEDHRRVDAAPYVLAWEQSGIDRKSLGLVPHLHLLVVLSRFVRRKFSHLTRDVMVKVIGTGHAYNLASRYLKGLKRGARRGGEQKVAAARWDPLFRRQWDLGEVVYANGVERVLRRLL